jgi:hypothetical protein
MKGKSKTTAMSIDDMAVELAFLAGCYKHNIALKLAKGKVISAPTGDTIVSRIRAILAMSDRFILDTSKLGTSIN